MNFLPYIAFMDKEQQQNLEKEILDNNSEIKTEEQNQSDTDPKEEKKRRERDPLQRKKLKN